MATLYTNINSNKRKTWLLLSGFAVFIVFFGWFLSYFFQNRAILYLAVGLGILQPLIAYFDGDKIMLTMSGATEIDHESNRDLYHSVENLCITAGLPMPKIYIIDDTAPNAFACGRDEKHSSIAVTKGLLMKLNKREMEGVIAHELSHIGNRDILIATITTVLVGIIVLLADWSLRFTFFGGKKSNNDNDRDNGQIQIILMVVALVLAILAPLFAQVIQLAISRKREFIADSAGVLLTRDPEGLIAALEKISADSEPLEVANRATDHAYIASPFKSDTDAKIGFFTRLFMTHPPIEERIAALKRGAMITK